MVLTLLLVVGGAAVSLLFLDGLFPEEHSPGHLLIRFLDSIRLPLGLSVAGIAILNGASFFLRSGESSWNDYPLLTWLVVLVNSFLAVRTTLLGWLKLDQTAFAVFVASVEPHRRVFGLVGLSVCGIKFVLMIEPLLRFVF